jgi:hypothetical protein
MKKNNDAPGMKGQRPRNEDGPLRQKRGDTLGKTLNEIYGTNFPPDITLDELRKKYKVISIQDIIKKSQGK